MKRSSNILVACCRTHSPWSDKNWDPLLLRSRQTWQQNRERSMPEKGQKASLLKAALGSVATRDAISPKSW